MTKQDILEASAKIFSDKGFHAASMSDVAEAVNLKKASLYHHVSSKQQILFEILETAIVLVTESIQAIVESEKTAEEKLRDSMIDYFKLLSTYKDQATVLLLEYRSLSPELKETHIKNRDAFEKLWRRIIIEGTEKGEFNCEHPGLAAKDVLGMMNWSIMWYRPDGELSAGEIAEHCADAYLNGLRN